LIKIFLLLFLAGQIFAQDFHGNKELLTKAIVEKALTTQTDYRLLEELCAIGPRLSGYPGAQKACRWAADKLREMGCDTVWLDPVTVPDWQRGNIEEAEITAPSKYANRTLQIGALGRSTGTGGKPLTAGVVEVDSFNRIDKMDPALISGKFVFFNEPFDQRMIRTFAAYSKAVIQRTKGPVDASRKGAVGALVRSVTSRDDNVPHVGVTRLDSVVKPVPAVAVGVQDAEFLSRALKTDPDLKITLTLSCANMGTSVSYNVVGEIRGSTFPEEIITIGGHLDAWDKGQGAHDDGAGCVQAMAVMGLFKKLHIVPDRTIRCVLFADEEQKQNGAEKYAARADSLHEHHVAAIESDRGGFTPRGFEVDADSTVIEMMQSFLPDLQPAGIEWIRKGGSGADVSYLKHIKARIGYFPDDQRYFDYHHSDNDTIDKVNPRELALGTASIAILTELISKNGL
jgi:carboxypeptidase Q